MLYDAADSTVISLITIEAHPQLIHHSK